MLKRYKFTDKEEKELLSSIGILIDTREQKNEHIIQYFDTKGIKYKKRKLDFGDYSFYAPKNENLGFGKDLYFDKEFAIERKASLDELSGNLTKDRARLVNEFIRGDSSMSLLIEDSTYRDIAIGNYGTRYNKKSYLASLHSLCIEYNIPFVFVDSRCSGLYIYMQCYYYLRNIIK